MSNSKDKGLLKRLQIGFVSILACLPLGLFGEESGCNDLPLQGKTEKLDFKVTSGSWVSVSLRAEEDALVFDLLGDLYQMPLRGGEAVQITSGLGFDSQPSVAPDGKRVAYISDRDGSNNLWIDQLQPGSKIDPNASRKLSDEAHSELISPSWSPDSQYVVVTRRSKDIELILYHVDGGGGLVLRDAEGKALEGVGAVFDPAGRFLYYAAAAESEAPVSEFPKTQIYRMNLRSGIVEQVTQGEGGGFKPLISPDGNWLVYGTRFETQSGFRMRNLMTGADRWVAHPIQRDTQENYRPSSRGLLPSYTFTSDGQAILYSAFGQFFKVDLKTGQPEALTFTANVSLDIGPDLTKTWRVSDQPFEATIVQDPVLSPDGKRFAASVLTRLYSMDAAGGQPIALTSPDLWAFKPVWSPDGRWLAFVSWTPNDGGHIYKIRSDGKGRVQRLTQDSGFYTDLVWSPDGASLYALRGNEWMRHQTFSEFTGLGIPLELVSVSIEDGHIQVIMPAGAARTPHFGPEPDRLYMYDQQTLFSVQLDGADRRNHLIVHAPSGNRNHADSSRAEEVRISPTGRHAIAHINKQVWVMPVPLYVGGSTPEVNINGGDLPRVKLTGVGADFLGWSADGQSIYWAIGSTIFSRSLESVEFGESADSTGPENKLTHDRNKKNAVTEKSDLIASSSVDASCTDDDTQRADTGEKSKVPLESDPSVSSTRFIVNVERDIPRGELLLAGAEVISMASTAADPRLEKLDILIKDNRIEAVGPTGSLEVRPGTHEVNLDGFFVIPGLIDTHAHWEFRTGDVLEPTNWSLIANLAYGVTSGLDVQTNHHDYFAYRDLVDAGLSIGQRAFMTGPGIFGDNDFQSYDEVLQYLRRYAEHYRTANIKAYVSGNRKQRQWIVLAAQELGLLPTTEGGGDQKMDLTHAIDGMHGNEHNLPDTPIYDDVINLIAKTRMAYTPTLIVQYNAPSAREYYFTREEVHDLEKLQRFYPHNRLDELTQRRPTWVRGNEFRIVEGAEAAAAIQRSGGLLGVGGHAELQGLGYHWEMWSYGLGGLSAAEILKAATIDAAHILGAPDDLGSIEPGKLADLVILTANPLEDIRHSITIDRVIKNGRIYDGDTLDQLWPEQVELPAFWWWNDSDNRYQPDFTRSTPGTN